MSDLIVDGNGDVVVDGGGNILTQAAPATASVDGFEDGDYTNNPSWSYWDEFGSGSLSVQTSIVKNGSYALKFEQGYDSSAEVSYNRPDNQLSDGVVFSTWFYHDTSAGADMGYGLSNDVENGSTYSFETDGVGIVGDGSDFSYQTADSSGSGISSGTIGSYSTGQWYKLEIVLYPSTSTADFRFYDSTDTVVSEVTGVSTSGENNHNYVKMSADVFTFAGDVAYYDDVTYDYST